MTSWHVFQWKRNDLYLYQNFVFKIVITENKYILVRKSIMRELTDSSNWNLECWPLNKFWLSKNSPWLSEMIAIRNLRIFHFLFSHAQPSFSRSVNSASVRRRKSAWKMSLGPTSARMTCPSCQSAINTRVELESSTMTHIFALLLCIFICPLVCVPYCCDVSCSTWSLTDW